MRQLCVRHRHQLISGDALPAEFVHAGRTRAGTTNPGILLQTKAKMGREPMASPPWRFVPPTGEVCSHSAPGGLWRIGARSRRGQSVLFLRNQFLRQPARFSSRDAEFQARAPKASHRRIGLLVVGLIRHHLAQTVGLPDVEDKSQVWREETRGPAAAEQARASWHEGTDTS